MNRKPYNIWDSTDKEKVVNYYVDYFLNMCQSMFEYTNLPESIPKRFLERYLQTNGNACIAKVNGTLYAFYGTVGGEPDVYYQPTLFVVANPALNLSREFKIGIDCIVIRNDSLMNGLIPIFRRYATSVMESDISLMLADINGRASNLISASDDRTAKSAELFQTRLFEGKQAIVTEQPFMEGLNVHPLQQTSNTVINLLAYREYLINTFFNRIGLHINNNKAKSQYVSPDEMNMGSDPIYPFIDNMMEERKLGIEAVNKLFGTDISVDFGSVWKRSMEREELLLDEIEEYNNDDTTESEEDVEDKARLSNADEGDI